MEVFAVNIRAHTAIQGTQRQGFGTALPALSPYGNDTTLISTSDDAIIAVFHTYDRFEKDTGSKLELGKCEGLQLGAWRNRFHKPVPIQ